MEDLRNLTAEAMEMAKQELFLDSPLLAKRENRIRLSSDQKEFIVLRLVTATQFYEQMLVQSIMTN